MVNCNKCGYCPCMRQECDLENGHCNFGKTLVEIYSEKEDKERMKQDGEY